MSARKFRLSILILLLLVSITVVTSVCLGAVKISPGQLWSMAAYHVGLSDVKTYTEQQWLVLINLRMPRIILGVLIGGGLAMAGSAIQGLFRNPLAEPGLIGVSSGATLFAALTIVFGGKLLNMAGSQYGYYILSAAAFTGALATTLLVYRLATHGGAAKITSLLLTGIAINALAFAFTGLLTYISTDEQLRNITFWSLGSLGGASWASVITILPFILIPAIVLPLLGKAFNALSLGEVQAAHLGFNVQRIKYTVIILATLAVGASVAAAGMIGFVGLVIPHILRLGFGPDNRFIVPGSGLLGAVVLSLADLLSRTVVGPAELPIGIVTALAGSPVFIYMISSQLKKQPI